MSDYRLELKIKNAPLYNAMIENGFNNVSELSRASGISQGCIGRFMNLQELPITKTGNIKKSVLALEKALRRHYEDLFPVDYKPLTKNKLSVDIERDTIDSIVDDSYNPVNLIMRDQFNFDVLISYLSDREKLCLSCRFEQDLTLEETGYVMGVSQARAMQIEKKALRKMRHPTRSENIRRLQCEVEDLQWA